MTGTVQQLVARGVDIRLPNSVLVADDVDPARIAPGAIIHPGCRLSGAATAMAPGAAIGAEGPVTLENSQLGRGAALLGGSCSGAVLWDGAVVGSAAHLRAGTLLEEESGGAHAVGFKQTILLPFVVTGSLINFCDALMAGGTSRKNHGEIGSSYVHFNFTPNQDKATPSLIGDVPRGVMLDQPPVFLGGQGGLVGPARIGFGNVIPAGIVFRGDALAENVILGAPAPAPGARPFVPGLYRDIRRLVRNNLIYVGNIRALRAWYRQVRQRYATPDVYRLACWEGALVQLDAVLAERVKRLDELAGKLAESARRILHGTEAELIPLARLQQDFAARWPEMRAALADGADDPVAGEARDRLLAALRPGNDYLAAIRALPAEARKSGTTWLQAVVDRCAAAWQPAQLER